MQDTLKQEMIQPWTKEFPPIYDIHKTYLENLQNGPCFEGSFFEREEPLEVFDFLGKSVASQIGVPAGPLLDSKWTSLAAKLGFDLVTYKTIRTKKHPCHPLPNMCYVKVDHESKTAIRTDELPEKLPELGVTNSFGMPSMDEEYLMKDIQKAKESLGKYQALIVSFAGTNRPDVDFYEDFVQAGLLAQRAGGEILEANFSCPNIATNEGSIYKSSEAVYTLGKKLKDALGTTPLIIKVGTFDDKEHMREVLRAAAKAGVNAVSGINTISMSCFTKDGKPALDENRKTSGICGGPILETGLNFVKNARAIIDEERLNLTLIGVGGITDQKHFQDYLDAGADFAQCATGMMWDPYLAARYHKEKGEIA